MNAQQHKEAIEAAVRAAEADGFHLSIENPCFGCCNAYEATLDITVRGATGWETTSVGIEI